MPNDSAFNVIAKAASLMRSCAGYCDDLKDRKRGWKVYYVLDTDIVQFYLDPQARKKYASVFGKEYEAAETRSLLAALAAQFLLKLSEQSVFIVIAPHDQEIRGRLTELTTKALADVEKKPEVDDEQFGFVFSHLQSGNMRKAARALLRAAPSIARLDPDYHTGSYVALKRFARIKDRLVTLRDFIEPPIDDDAGNASAVPWRFPTNELIHREEEYTVQRERWEELIGARRPRTENIRPTNNERDATVLATIQSVNAALERGNSKRKLVLITGTPAVLEAAQTDRFHSGEKSFGDLYVRDLRAFMADREFFAPGRPDGKDSFRLMDWLNLFFPQAWRDDDAGSDSDIDRRLLSKLESASESKDEFEVGAALLDGFPLPLVEGWKTQVQAAAVNFGGIHQVEKTLADQLQVHATGITTAAETRRAVEELITTVRKVAVESLSSLYASTSWLGMWSVDIVHESIRGIPALRFEGNYQEAVKYFSAVIQAMKDQTQPGVAVAEIYRETSKEDPSLYHGHVIHAVAYATKGHWYAAGTLCRLALAKADALSEDEKAGRRGREAAYLLAVVERRLAKTWGDFDSAQRWLFEAHRRDNGPDIHDVRFDCEQFAIDVARLNFRFFVAAHQDQRLDAETVTGLMNRASDIMKRTTEEDNRLIRDRLRRQTGFNVLDLALLAKCAGVEIIDQQLLIVHEFLRWGSSKPDLLLGDEGQADFPAVRFICYAAEAVYGERARRSEAFAKLRDINFPVFAPFDPNRAKRFRELAAEGAG